MHFPHLHKIRLIRFEIQKNLQLLLDRNSNQHCVLCIHRIYTCFDNLSKHFFWSHKHSIKKSRPISRILSFLRTDHHPSSYVIAYVIKQPTRQLERAVLKRYLSGLASSGVYQAICITTNTGGLLHHRFTLTHLHVRSIFCGTNPADFSGWALPTTLLFEVRTFLGACATR